MTELTGPDFICAGTAKGRHRMALRAALSPSRLLDVAGQGISLLRQCFSQIDNRRMITESREDTETLDRRRGRLGFPRITERDQLFFDDVLSCSSGGTDLEEYARLFRHKNGQLSGDITPAYCALNDALIGRIAKAFPNLKVIFLIRDPVARCWSRLQMRERRTGFSRTSSTISRSSRFRCAMPRTKWRDFRRKSSRAGRRTLRNPEFAIFSLTKLRRAQGSCGEKWCSSSAAILPRIAVTSFPTSTRNQRNPKSRCRTK